MKSKLLRTTLVTLGLSTLFTVTSLTEFRTTGDGGLKYYNEYGTLGVNKWIKLDYVS